VATQIQDTSRLNGSVQSRFVSSAEAVDIHLSLFYGWPRMNWLAPTRSIPTRWDLHSSLTDATVHLLNADQQTIKSFEPGSAITLSVSEMLNLAGVVSLDTVEPLAGANQMPNAHAVGAAGPTKRLAGMQLKVQVLCGGLSNEEKACRLQVSVVPGAWISDSIFCNVLAGDNTYRTCRGIQIEAVFGGSRLLVDLNALLINICASVVFLQVPRTIILLTALYLCGHISTVYRNVVYKRFSITSEAGAMAMRLLQHDVIFNELDSAANNGTLSGQISKASIRSSLRHIFERRECLDDAEVLQIADFALTEVTNTFHDSETNNDASLYGAFMTVFLDGLSHFWANIKESFGVLSKKTDHSELKVNVDKFVAACSSNEQISFRDLVKLFDADRKLSFLERFFMPTHFKMCLAEIRGRNPGLSNENGSKDGQSNAKINVRRMHPINSSVGSDFSAEQVTFEEVRGKVLEALSKIDMMTEQINACMLRLDEQQSKHEFEQSEARQEIHGLKDQMAHVSQVFGSFQICGLQAPGEEQMDISSTQMPGVEHFDHKPEKKEKQLTKESSIPIPGIEQFDHEPKITSPMEQPLSGDVQYRWHQEAKGPKANDTIAENLQNHHCRPYSLKEACKNESDVEEHNFEMCLLRSKLIEASKPLPSDGCIYQQIT